MENKNNISLGGTIILLALLCKDTYLSKDTEARFHWIQARIERLGSPTLPAELQCFGWSTKLMIALIQISECQFKKSGQAFSLHFYC